MLIQKQTAGDFIEMMRPRDYPDERHHVVPGVDQVQVSWDEASDRALLGPDAAGHHYPMAFDTYRQLAKLLALSPVTFRKMPPRETVGMVNHQLLEASQPYLIYAMKDGVITHWIKGGNLPEPCDSIVRHVAASLQCPIEDMEVWLVTDSIDSTRFQVINAARPIQLQGEDICIGVAVENSRSWEHPLRFSTYIHHVKDEVGAIGGNLFSRHARRRVLDNQGTWVSQSIDSIVARSVESARSLQALHEVDIRGHLTPVMRSLFKDMRAPKEIREELYGLVLGSEMNTLYDVYKAVARLGSDVRHRWMSTAIRYKVLGIAGDLAAEPDRCPTCFRSSL